MFKNSNPRGFTLIELLVVVAIIGILASVVLASLNSARNKGVDAAIKSTLYNAVKQAEILYSTRTANVETYINVCTNGAVDGAQGIGSLVLAAAKNSGLASYGIDNVPPASTSVATCNDGTGVAWAAEVPLKTAGQMWCVDSTAKSKQTSASIGASTVCP